MSIICRKCGIKIGDFVKVTEKTTGKITKKGIVTGAGVKVGSWTEIKIDGIGTTNSTPRRSFGCYCDTKERELRTTPGRAQMELFEEAT